jgi:hypothetical protein
MVNTPPGSSTSTITAGDFSSRRRQNCSKKGR